MSDWVYDHARHAYYHVESKTYATIDPVSGAWQYVSADDLNRPAPDTAQPGWGAFLEPGDQRGEKAPERSDSASKRQPSTLRLVVRDSTVLDVGHVAMIDPSEDSVQVGRDRSDSSAPPRLRIKEMEVSKVHAALFCDDGQWCLVDLGSTQGTFVDEERLSGPKSASKPQVLRHLATIRIGNTTLIAHIHDSWPCQDCQLTGGNEIRLDRGPQSDTPVGATPDNTTNAIPYAMDSQERRDNRENRRKREMAALRANLLNT